MIRALLFLSVLLLSTPALSYMGGGSTSSINRAPNVIIIMVDDIGREMYPQLGSPYRDMGLDHTIGADFYGDRLPFITAEEMPHLTELMANGINFEGAWAGAWCRATRNMLRIGVINGEDEYPNSPRYAFDPDRTLKALMDNNARTSDTYDIYHYGKYIGGCERAAGGADQGPCPAMSNGDAQNDRIAGIATNSPSQWWDTWTTVQDNLTYYDQPLTTVTPRVDPELPLIDGTPIQFQDEFGVDQAIAYIEDLHAVNGEIPKDFWSTSTQKPFMITLGLHNVHGGRGYWCWDERTALGSVVPYANLLAKIATSGKNYGTSSKWAEGPGTQIYNETQRAEMMADAANGADSWKPWIDCAMTQLKWTDDQIGRLVDWLGPEGLANTLIIFTGDNGTVSEMLPTRHGVDVGTDKLVLDSAPYSVTIDSQGKGTQGEAGLNVPMILAHGPVAKRLYGTSSKARMNLADVVETLAHLSEGTTSTDTQYTPHGRDFSSLVYGTAADQDRLLGVTVSSLNFNGEVSAIHDPLPNGDIWRLHVMPAVDGVRNCMYIQNLALPPGTEASPTDTAFTNFRSEFNSEQADFEFIGAILDMIDEINCAYGGISSCRSNTRLYEPVPHEDWLGFEPNDPTAQCDGVTPFRLMPD